MNKIKAFSPHLFWDVNLDIFDFEKSKKWLIARVVEYGDLNDWRNLLSIYGEEEIKKEVTTIRSLDAVSVSFLAAYFSLDKKDFRCYTPNPSTHDFWKS